MTYPQDPYQQQPGYDPYAQQPSPYGPNPYGADPYGQQFGYGAYPGYGGYPAPPGTNGLAVGAMITSIFGLFCYGVPALIGAILGHAALSQVKRTGQSGQGMALAGVIIGWIGFALWLAFLILYVSLGLSETV